MVQIRFVNLLGGMKEMDIKALSNYLLLWRSSNKELSSDMQQNDSVEDKLSVGSSSVGNGCVVVLIL